MSVDTEIRHITKAGSNIFLELGFEAVEAKQFQETLLKRLYLTDWNLFLKRWGLTEKMIQEQMDSREYADRGSYGVSVKDSLVQGKGLFLANYRSVKKGGDVGYCKRGDRYTEFARYINHSSSPNVEFDFNSKYTTVLALRDIQPGEELFVDYNRNGEELMKGKLE